MVLTPEIFSTNPKLRLRYFFGMPYTVLRGKKSKLVRVTVRSIWVAVPHMLPLDRVFRERTDECAPPARVAQAPEDQNTSKNLRHEKLRRREKTMTPASTLPVVSYNEALYICTEGPAKCER